MHAHGGSRTCIARAERERESERARARANERRWMEDVCVCVRAHARARARLCVCPCVRACVLVNTPREARASGPTSIDTERPVDRARRVASATFFAGILIPAGIGTASMRPGPRWEGQGAERGLRGRCVHWCVFWCAGGARMRAREGGHVIAHVGKHGRERHAGALGRGAARRKCSVRRAAIGRGCRRRKGFSGAPAPSGTGLPLGTATILPWLPAETPLAHTAHTSSIAIMLRTERIMMTSADQFVD
jgi:hypothetical protein